MTDYATKLSFTLRCTPEAADRLVAAFAVKGVEAALPVCIADVLPPTEPDDPLSGLGALHAQFPFSTDAEIAPVEGGVCIWAEDAPQLDTIAGLIRILAPGSLPTGFTGVDTCSEVRTGGSFGGGYAVITQAGNELHDVTALLTQDLEAAHG